MTSPTRSSTAAIDPGRLVAAHRAARGFYRRQLLAADGPRRYLAGRGLGVFTRDPGPTGGVDQPWQLGYAPTGWTTLVEHLSAAGFAPAELVAAGLAVPSRRGGMVDVFRDRIMFPIHNGDGEAVAFLGRAAPNAESDVPRYLNSTDTAIYHKRATLYGLGEQPDRANAGAAPVIVEGPTDVLAVWLAHDHTDAGLLPVAACGTSLTEQHAAPLLDLPGTRRHGIITAYDNDPAGHAATLRAWHLLHVHTGTNLRAATLPPGTDPGSLAGSPENAEALRRALTDQARPLVQTVIDITLDQLLARHPDALIFIEGRLTAVRGLAPLLTNLPAQQILTLADHIARRTGAGIDLVADIIIDHLERDPPRTAPTPRTPVRPAPARDGPDPATPPRESTTGAAAAAPAGRAFLPPASPAASPSAAAPASPGVARSHRSR